MQEVNGGDIEKVFQKNQVNYDIMIQYIKVGKL